MPYELDETNEPLTGDVPVQEQAKAASPDRLEVVQSVEVKRAFMPYPENVDAYIEAAFNSQEAMPAIIDLAVACAAGNTRSISAITSKCSVCGYEETLELPQETSAEDMQLAMQETLLTPCPSCEESLQAQIARNEPGLVLLDEDGETTILDIQLPD